MLKIGALCLIFLSKILRAGNGSAGSPISEPVVGAVRESVVREHGAQGSHSSLAAFPPRRGFGGAARTRSAGKAAAPESGPCVTTRVQTSFSWTPMSARPFAVGGRLALPSVYIAAEPGSVARRSRNQIVARPSWPCRSRAGRRCHNVGAPLVGALKSAMPTGRAGTRPAPTS